jgi:hypothetical protein
MTKGFTLKIPEANTWYSVWDLIASEPGFDPTFTNTPYVASNVMELTMTVPAGAPAVNLLLGHRNVKPTGPPDFIVADTKTLQSRAGANVISLKDIMVNGAAGADFNLVVSSR